MIDGKKVEAKAAVPRNSGSGNSLTKKMFVGGTVSLFQSLDIAGSISMLYSELSFLHALVKLSMGMTVQGDIADEEFSQYFSQFGDIEDCVVSRHCMHRKHMRCLSALPVPHKEVHTHHSQYRKHECIDDQVVKLLLLASR